MSLSTELNFPLIQNPVADHDASGTLDGIQLYIMILEIQRAITLIQLELEIMDNRITALEP